MMENTADQYQTALNIADFPALFSVLLNNDVSCDNYDWIEF
jgi:hypothetical protein